MWFLVSSDPAQIRKCRNTSEDLAAFQYDMESKERFTFGFEGWLKLSFLSSQLSFSPTLHFVQLSQQYLDLCWAAES